MSDPAEMDVTLSRILDLAGTGTFSLVAADVGWQANWVPGPVECDAPDCQCAPGTECGLDVPPKQGAWDASAEKAIQMLHESVGEFHDGWK